MSPDLPVPVNDGAADHLLGREIPELSLASALGGQLDLAVVARGLVVVYVYPRTGRPGEPLPEGWDEIPGARGCTPQSCAFRDHVTRMRSYRRLTFIARERRIIKVFYPVFPPERNASEVLAWLAGAA